MAGPPWNDDDPADLPRIGANVQALLTDLATVTVRVMPTVTDAARWHTQLYVGCSVPSATYVGTFRGDASAPDLFDYEVGVGPIQPDGWPEKVGVWAADVATELGHFEQALHRALAVLDAMIGVGSRPSTVDELDEVVQLVADVHGEWVRIHPFVNGNGRTARVWAAVLAMRYGLPPFVRLTPRPHDVAYARAARMSMGRPPDFVGDHTGAHGVFTRLLALSLLP